MTIEEQIKKLVDFGITKKSIAESMGISKQLLNFKLRNKSEFKIEHMHKFSKKYSKVLNQIIII